MTKGEEFFQKLSSYRAKSDIEGMVDNLYHEDIELVCFPDTLWPADGPEILPRTPDSVPVIKGKEAVKNYLMKKPKIQGKVLGMSLDYFAASDDVVIYRGTIKTEHSFVKSEEAWHLKDEKMYRHIMLTLPPDKTREWVAKEL